MDQLKLPAVSSFFTGECEYIDRYIAPASEVVKLETILKVIEIVRRSGVQRLQSMHLYLRG